jgi:hypothetical protein
MCHEKTIFLFIKRILICFSFFKKRSNVRLIGSTPNLSLLLDPEWDNKAKPLCLTSNNDRNSCTRNSKNKFSTKFFYQWSMHWCLKIITIEMGLFFFNLYQKETYFPCQMFSSNLLSSLNGEQYLPASVWKRMHGMWTQKGSSSYICIWSKPWWVEDWPWW